MKKIIAIIATLTVFPTYAVEVSVPTGLEALNESNLSEVSGQAGVAIGLEYRINIDKSGNNTSCGALDCRMALGLADRNGGWLVIKDYRAIIRLNNVYVDVSTLSGTNSTHRDTSAMLGFDPNNKPAIQLTTSEWTKNFRNGGLTGTAMTNYLKSNIYNDFEYYASMGAITAEFDNASAVGYLRNANTGAALSLRMADGATGIAGSRMRLDGRLQLFGY